MGNWLYGRKGAKGFDSDTYPAIGVGKNGKDKWRDALAAGNGEIGILESFSPEEDVIVYQNTKLILDTNEIFHVPYYADILDEQRKNAVIRKDTGCWVRKAADYNEQTYGVKGYVSSNSRTFHPAAQLRIRNLKCREVVEFNRYTNFETGEIGGQWKDRKKCEWNIRSFASRKDNVIITEITAPESEQLDTKIWIDNLLEMSVETDAFIDRGVPEIPQTCEFVEEDWGKATDNGDNCNEKISKVWMGQVGKYGTFYTSGSPKKYSEYAYGGWSVTICILTNGKVEIEDHIRDIQVQPEFCRNRKEKMIPGFQSQRLHIQNADKIILLAEIDKKEHRIHCLDDAKKMLFKESSNRLNGLAQKYKVQGEFQYEQALSEHKKLHQKAFSRMDLELCFSAEDKADRELTNEALIYKQQHSEKINKAYLERLFQNGRYLLLCSSGYHVPRMNGIWTGSWLPLFQGNFITDANVNLQIASMNIGNMEEVAAGYINFILRQLLDWEKNAGNIYGMTGALKAPSHTDGSGNGELYHSLPGYPHGYWNASTDWMIYPIFEYYECFGRVKVPVGKDVDLPRLKRVLELEDDDIARIVCDGFDLLKDILVPVIAKIMKFWVQYTDNRFYRGGDGTIHLADGTTIEEEENTPSGFSRVSYILSPGYSPENAPGGIGYNGMESVAANVTMDISAIKNSLYMAKKIYADSRDMKLEIQKVQWEVLERRLPEYLYTEDGALKEWALDSLKENYNHRHISHAYAAWPCHEAEENRVLRLGIFRAIQKRTLFNQGDDAMSHGHLHKALASARIKDKKEVARSLYILISEGYQYTSLLTSHDKNHESAFCTDNAITLPGIVLEALLYSNDHIIEALPALPDGLHRGNIRGIKTRTSAGINRLTWMLTDEKEESKYIEMEIAAADGGEQKEIHVKVGVTWKWATVDGVEAEVRQDSAYESEKYVNLQLQPKNIYIIKFFL
ncbi:glycosyl hydrolase family 95 catalytic domain-containing protein [uncultured Robinsoniella sp.]|uniref:glycosyl hydrolase family 95 catalytic domain-containing protein n=1 Tax=uncultured Robinsoniella sp. TaxID=904190 RepID=UPI002908B682|nr:glycoside hydrolase N-terminal domain-containing protein [Clostridiales bacterium]